MFKCFFGHKKEILKIEHYVDTSYKKYFPQGRESTACVWKCSKCGQLERESFYGFGFLSKEDLTKK